MSTQPPPDKGPEAADISPVPLVSRTGILVVVGFVLVGLGLFGLTPYMLLDRYCASEHAASRPVPPEAAKAPAGHQGGKNAAPTASAEREPLRADNWRRKFWCELRGSDLALSLFTFLLVCATAGLIFTGIQQSAYMRRSWKSARAAAGAAIQQARAAEAAFLSTHRPRIRIKHLWLTSEIWQKEKLEFTLVIVNHGDTDARIVEMGFSTLILPAEAQLPARPPFLDTSRFGSRAALLPSGITYVFEHVSDNRVLSDAENGALRRGESKLYCYGYVDYTDSMDRVRKTAFCRVLDFPTKPSSYLDVGRLVLVNDPDYEFAD